MRSIIGKEFREKEEQTLKGNIYILAIKSEAGQRFLVVNCNNIHSSSGNLREHLSLESQQAVSADKDG